MGNIRRGSAAIQEAAERTGSGDFKPFLPKFYWNEDGQERFVLFLNEIEDLPLFDMIRYIPIPDTKFFAETVSKTDQFFGEKSDDFERLWDATAKQTNIAVAVELEPVVEIVNKRRKPRGFEIKTVEYERRVYDDDGEATGETEEVTSPCVGYIAQSPSNFFKPLSYYDANTAPIVDTALKITRIGKDASTTFQFEGYDELPIDLTNLVECIDGVNYLHEEMDDLLVEIDGIDANAAALIIGKHLLDKVEDELVDDERYQELLEGVTESMDTFGNKKKKGKKKDEPARSRAASRHAKKEEEPVAESTDDPDEPASDPEPTEEVKPRKARKGTEKQTPKARMDELRAKAAERAATRK